ncbi:glycosyltransferase [Candidatus Sumerlaeota bacterium]|nr:glycosyltransferase [Candidatus Sumerlaeota bacterium]
MVEGAFISVVVVNYHEHEGNFQKWIEVLSEALDNGEAELILVHAGMPPHLPEGLLRRSVRTLRSEESFSPSRERGMGLTECRGRYIAFTEGHCAPDQQWWTQWRSFLADSQCNFAWGRVDRRGGSCADWAMTLIEYGRFGADIQSASPALCLVNGIFAASYLNQLDEHLRNDMDEYALGVQLRNTGGRMHFNSRAMVYDCQQGTLIKYCSHLYRHGRSHGRRSLVSLPPLRKVVRTILLPVIPAILLLRIGRMSLRTRRLFKFMWAFPALVPLAAAWVWGEWSGMVSRRR